MTVSFIERKRGQCVYIVAPQTCCGEPVSASSSPYCQSHHAVAYQDYRRQARGGAGLGVWPPKRASS
jgi:hypothetical protein